MFKVRNEVLQKYNIALTLSKDPGSEKIQSALEAIQKSQEAFANYYKEQGLWGKIFQIIDKITGKGSKLSALAEKLSATLKQPETLPKEKETTPTPAPEKVNLPSEPINKAEQTPESQPVEQEDKEIDLEAELFSLDITRIERCRVGIEKDLPNLSIQEKLEINNFVARALVKLKNFVSSNNYKEKEFLALMHFQKLIGTGKYLGDSIKDLVKDFLKNGNFSEEEKAEAEQAFGIS